MNSSWIFSEIIVTEISFLPKFLKQVPKWSRTTNTRYLILTVNFQVALAAGNLFPIDLIPDGYIQVADYIQYILNQRECWDHYTKFASLSLPSDNINTLLTGSSQLQSPILLTFLIVQRSARSISFIMIPLSCSIGTWTQEIS